MTEVIGMHLSVCLSVCTHLSFYDVTRGKIKIFHNGSHMRQRPFASHGQA